MGCSSTVTVYDISVVVPYPLKGCGLQGMRPSLTEALGNPTPHSGLRLFFWGGRRQPEIPEACQLRSHVVLQLAPLLRAQFPQRLAHLTRLLRQPVLLEDGPRPGVEDVRVPRPLGARPHVLMAVMSTVAAVVQAPAAELTAAATARERGAALEIMVRLCAPANRSARIGGGVSLRLDSYLWLPPSLRVGGVRPGRCLAAARALGGQHLLLALLPGG